MRNFSIGSLALITNGQPANGYLLQTPIDGLDSPSIRQTMYSIPGRDRSSISSQFYDSRVLTLQGVIYAYDNSAATYENLRTALISAVTVQKDSNGYPLPVRVSFTTLAGTNCYVDAYFSEPKISYDRPLSTDFQLVATATNPFIYLQASTTSGNISRALGGGYVVPMIAPYTSSASAGGTTVLNNAGTATALPVITLYGPLTNPVISNTTTGLNIKLNYTLGSSDYITIDMEHQVITLDNSSSLIGYKDTYSTWWGIDPGNNNIGLSTDSTSDSGYMQITFNAPLVGI